MMWTRPVDTQVSQATRASGSWARISSRMASEIWSQILSGCPSVTDSDVKRCLAIDVYASTMQTVEKFLKQKDTQNPKAPSVPLLSSGFPQDLAPYAHAQVVGLHRACPLSRS